MLGADIALATYNATTSTWSAGDYWAEGFRRPVLDAKQDVALVAAQRGGGRTSVTLTRPLVSCDAVHDQPVLSDTRQVVVAAYGPGAFSYHGPRRATQGVVLLPAAGAANASAAAGNVTLRTIELRSPNVTIPADDTSYICVNLELPSDAKYHVYRVEPLIERAQHVHHYVAYSCYGDAAPPPTALGTPYDCMQVMECSDYFLGWAPGGGDLVTPPEAALAFGSGTGVRYLALQIHYTNLEGAVGQVDSSGFRLHYSATLKPHDMGVLTLGSEEIGVPAGAAAWSTLPNVCPGACTARLGRPITLVESFYHMHQTGIAMVTRHIRDNVELPPLGERRFYDFNYQASVPVPPASRTLLPGDSLITTCTYTGAGRNTTTPFGLASYQEMCYNFLWYYPYNASINFCMAFSGGYTLCTNSNELGRVTADGDGLTQPEAVALFAAGKLLITPDPGPADTQPAITPFNATANCTALRAFTLSIGAAASPPPSPAPPPSPRPPAAIPSGGSAPAPPPPPPGGAAGSSRWRLGGPVGLLACLAAWLALMV